MNDEFPYLTTSQVAQIAGESVMTIHRRIKAGVIKVINTPVGRLVHESQLNAYLESRGEKRTDGYQGFRNSDLLEKMAEQEIEKEVTENEPDSQQP
ncbi:helix-turn-helix domain-containing protein [Streptomyces scabiei]|uniref:helix-turn-helix domain-containing protein n=1 Tax=Streptomyces scabiei TaxID=1930 RepID=UPI0029A54B5E|nr:helix-turn-helix domain-containing protein [Streptomyces scabiei]MDX2689288.1 helix-turn-helix domain-containing protein [Streptomyces scabiei]